ncbi:hypothetical protein [Rothia nasimurium]|uniref:hypothetical protein n=1 Tax=Rothia nasimurium TaxID=85336 RepID=UPI001F28796A|nr:hypothetical protein [Rothia nasimurium]
MFYCLDIISTHLAVAVAYTDGLGRIWVDPRLTRTERRCALVHEHRHLAHGDTCHSEKAERRARRETALILLPQLPTAHDDLTPHQVAEHYDVTLTVLTDRLLIERGEL